jgi:hypothetical protein
MKMLPEFNLSSIISKISLNDIKHSGLARQEGAQSDFVAFLDKALADHADSPAATAVATLHKSGMDLPMLILRAVIPMAIRKQCLRLCGCQMDGRC